MERAQIRGARGIVAIWIAAVALGGCALTISGPDPRRPRDRLPVCDTSKGFVATDALLGAALGIGAVAAIGADAGEAALVPAALGTVFILSAIRGNGQANECRAALAEYEETVDRQIEAASERQAAARRKPRAAPSASGSPEVTSVVRAAAGALQGAGAPAKQPAVRNGAPRSGTPPPLANTHLPGYPPAAAPVGPAAGPPTAPPVAAPPVAAPPVAAPPVAAPPVAAPPIAAPAAPPRPAAPAAPRPPPPPPPLPPPPSSDRWIDFWKELP